LGSVEEERDKAQAVKQHAPILVILGNPPYNGFAGAAMDEERDLVTAYRTVKRVAPPQGRGLNDLYVRFFRMAERRITAGAEGRVVVCFISNYSWLGGLSSTGMRERFLEVFDGIWIDCLNGDKYKTGKLTPEGLPDPSVFSTEKNREGIQVGTAVSLLVRRADHAPPAEVRFAHHWGKHKVAELVRLAVTAKRTACEALKPATDLALAFTPSVSLGEYFRWPLLPDLLPVSLPGVQSKRDELVVDIDREQLVKRMEQYFDPKVGDDVMRLACDKALASTAQFDAPAIRKRLSARGFLPQHVVPYRYRPFDTRWIDWEPEEPLLSRRSPDYLSSGLRRQSVD
jgi:hypothetical protein